MKKLLDHIIKRTLMAEQDAPAGDAAALIATHRAVPGYEDRGRAEGAG